MKWRNHIEPDFYNGNRDSDEGEQDGYSSVCHQFFQVGDFNWQNIRKTVVALQPELKICLERGFNDQGKTDCDRSFEQRSTYSNILYTSL